jgi:hypothetical protein
MAVEILVWAAKQSLKGEPHKEPAKEVDKLHPSWNDPDRGWI